MSSQLVTGWENRLHHHSMGVEDFNCSEESRLKQGLFEKSSNRNMGQRFHHCKTPSTSSDSSLGSLDDEDASSVSCETEATEVGEIDEDDEEYQDKFDTPRLSSWEEVESPFPPSPHQPLPNYRLPIPQTINPTSTHYSIKDFPVEPLPTPPTFNKAVTKDVARFPSASSPYPQVTNVVGTDVERRLLRLKTSTPLALEPLSRVAMRNSYGEWLKKRTEMVSFECQRLRNDMQSLMTVSPPSMMVLQQAQLITSRMQYLTWFKSRLEVVKGEFETKEDEKAERWEEREWERWEQRKEELEMWREQGMEKVEKVGKRRYQELVF